MEGEHTGVLHRVGGAANNTRPHATAHALRALARSAHAVAAAPFREATRLVRLQVPRHFLESSGKPHAVRSYRALSAQTPRAHDGAASAAAPPAPDHELLTVAVPPCESHGARAQGHRRRRRTGGGVVGVIGVGLRGWQIRRWSSAGTHRTEARGVGASGVPRTLSRRGDLACRNARTGERAVLGWQEATRAACPGAVPGSARCLLRWRWWAGGPARSSAPPPRSEGPHGHLVVGSHSQARAEHGKLLLSEMRAPVSVRHWARGLGVVAWDCCRRGLLGCGIRSSP
mmetsp:Transcript_12442/g.37260  ORF Transcript_12442/g.37260 Transcript_12442/m.37260 type:complete len:286 (+) Transcript_12442:1362-2219(+)